MPQKNVKVVQVIRTVHKVGGPPPVYITPPKPKEDPKPQVQIKTPAPNSPRPDFLEPLSPASMQKKLTVDMQQRITDYWNYQMEQPWFWEEKIELLEREREKYNKKRGWSGKDLAAVEAIDEEIKYCLKNLEELQYSEEEDAGFDETF